MTNMNALGYFMDYCNRNGGTPGITQTLFQRGMREILSSPEGRFQDCRDARDVLREIKQFPD